MRNDVSWFLVESGPVFTLCQEWLESLFSARRAAMDFAKRYGSENCYTHNTDGSFAGAYFPYREVPEGWTKPRGKDKLSWPKKRTEAYEELQGLPSAKAFHPELEGVVGPIPTVINYEGEGCKGSFVVGHFFGAGCYTFNSSDGPFLIDVPDAAKAWQQKITNNPEYKCTNGAHEFKFADDGCREILREEWDLMAARHKLAQESEAA